MDSQTAIISAPRITIPPAVGDYMLGARKGRSWRITAVTALRQAGNTRYARYRLMCEPNQSEIPPEATVHPWRLAVPRPPPRPAPELDSPLLARMGIRDRAVLERLQVKAPLLLALGLEPMHRAKADEARRQQQRIARIGRDRGVVDRLDFGPSLRMEAVRNAAGKVLREADVSATMEPDEPGSRRLQRRARRADPLATLLRYKSITLRQFEAVELLRRCVEIATPGIQAAQQGGVPTAPWARTGISRRQLAACAVVREAFATIPFRDRLALAWMLGGGSVGGLALYAHRAEETVLVSLRSALSALEAFYAAQDRS